MKKQVHIKGRWGWKNSNGPNRSTTGITENKKTSKEKKKSQKSKNGGEISKKAEAQHIAVRIKCLPYKVEET